MIHKQNRAESLTRLSINLVRISIFFMSLILVACPKDVEGFAVGMKRSEVYKRMGSPSNTDDGKIAIWTHDKSRSGKGWREICGDGKDAYIAVFGPGEVSIMPCIGFSATTIDISMSDEYVVKLAIDQMSRRPKP